MFSILKPGVYKHPEDLDVVFRLDGLSFNYEGFRAGLICFTGEVDDGRLLGFERYVTPLFLV